MTAQLFDFPTVNPPMPGPPKKKLPKKEKYTAEFEAFWLGYPRKLNCSKLMAFRAWNKLDDDEQAQAVAALPAFQRMMRGKDEQYIPHPATWLNQKRFETIQVIAVPSPAANAQPDWAAIMRLYRITSDWKQDNGPPPGSAGCKVPWEFL